MFYYDWVNMTTDLQKLLVTHHIKREQQASSADKWYLKQIKVGTNL